MGSRLLVNPHKGKPWRGSLHLPRARPGAVEFEICVDGGIHFFRLWTTIPHASPQCRPVRVCRAPRAPRQAPDWPGAAGPAAPNSNPRPCRGLAYCGRKLVLTMGPTIILDGFPDNRPAPAWSRTASSSGNSADKAARTERWRRLCKKAFGFVKRNLSGAKRKNDAIGRIRCGERTVRPVFASAHSGLRARGAL